MGVSRDTSGLHCIRCGYALDGLSPQGNCPECASSIQTTLEADVVAAWVARSSPVVPNVLRNAAITNIAELFVATVWIGSLFAGVWDASARWVFGTIYVIVLISRSVVGFQTALTKPSYQSRGVFFVHAAVCGARAVIGILLVTGAEGFQLLALHGTLGVAWIDVIIQVNTQSRLAAALGGRTQRRLRVLSVSGILVSFTGVVLTLVGVSFGAYGGAFLLLAGLCYGVLLGVVASGQIISAGEIERCREAVLEKDQQNKLLVNHTDNQETE